MREGLKRRIKGTNPTNTLSIIKKEYIGRNMPNNPILSNHCGGSNNCSNIRDANGFWIGTDQNGQREQRSYYAPFRQPLKGWRKKLNCDANNSNNRCWKVTEIYKDTYTDCSHNDCTTKGSLSNTKLATGNTNRASSGISTRSLRPLIRSGMQPNTAGQQNSGITSKKQYSYSYHELIKNRRKDTYIKKLATEEPTGNNIITTGYGGSCTAIDNCSSGRGQNIYRLNNNKFKTQGAVESSSRIDRLKYDTIKGQSKCPTGKQTGPKEDRSNCNGVYFAGKPRGMFALGNGSQYTQRKYVALFNDGHTEVNYPQTSALARVRGAVSHKTTVNPKGGICCNHKPPQFLM